jgi:hypothetical protein
MGIRSKPFFRHAMIAAIALAAATGWLGASPAHAQSHSGAALPPSQIERMIAARGYRLTGPVVRHGKVYFANVLGQQDDVEQLVVDARDGHLLRQSPGGPPMRRQGGNPDEWSPLGSFFGALFGAPEDAAPLSPPPASDFYENPKPKTQVKHSRPSVQPASLPGDAKAPSASPDAATPGAAPPTAATPSAATPTAAAPSVAPPAVAGAKATPETATAAPGAAASKTPAAKLNDVPVAPLE